MHQPSSHLPAQFGPPPVPSPAAAVRPARQLPPHILQRAPHVVPTGVPPGVPTGAPPGVPPGVPPNIRPFEQHDIAATQQQVLMLQVGAVATLFGSNQDNALSYEEYHKNQLENAGILSSIEDCRYREEAMLNLEEAVTQSSLPRLFGLNEVNRSLTVKLFPPKRNPRVETNEEEEGDRTKERFPYPSILPYKNSEESNNLPLPNQDNQKGKESSVDIKECLENLILTCTSPVLGLGNLKGRQQRCLAEAPPGGFVVAPSAVLLLSEIAYRIIQDTIAHCMEVRSENPVTDEIDESSLREAMRRLGKTRRK